MIKLIKVALVLGSVVLLGGCAIGPMEPIKIDPSYNRVAVINDSQYVINLEGVLNGSLRPGQTASTNVACYGRFYGIATAYRIKGTRRENEVLEYYGQSKFYLYVDGRNTVYKGKSLDSFRRLTDGNFYYRRRGREYIVAPKVNCGFISGSTISGSITFGR